MSEPPSKEKLLRLINEALAASANSVEVEQRQWRMTALYKQVCLETFPDDKAVEAQMRARNARELPRSDVKVTMGNDPARGWDLGDGGATLWIEYPPFHACSVRWFAPQIGDLHAYRAVAGAYESGIGGFQPIGQYDNDQGAIHVHAVGEQRVRPDKSSESLFIFDQHVTDERRRAAGETGVSLRFVHQFAPPPSSNGS